MANTFPPDVVYDNGIYVPQLPEEFKISKSALYDYYSTNSGMFPKNPGGGGGGGGGDVSALVPRVKSLENTRDAQANAAQTSIDMLSGIIPADKVDEIEDLVQNQDILHKSQRNILNAIGD